MHVRFQKSRLQSLPSDEKGYARQVFLSEAKPYAVYAISVYKSIVFLQIVDDLRTPQFFPRSMFEVQEPGIPSDWICNVFPEGPVQLVMGPPYVAKDLDSYNAMIDNNRLQMEELFKRVDSENR